MTLRYLLDENVALALLLALSRHDPALTVWTVGEPKVDPFVKTLAGDASPAAARRYAAGA